MLVTRDGTACAETTIERRRLMKNSRRVSLLTVFAVTVPVTILSAAGQAATHPVGNTAVQEFNDDVADYLRLRQGAETSVRELSVTNDPRSLTDTVNRLSDRIRKARPNARRGDVFTPGVTREFRGCISRAMHDLQETPADLLAAIREDTSANRSKHGLAVNGTYKWAAGWAMPPEILQALPDLPDPLEYRFVNRDLLLVDVDADLIVDILPEAIPRQ
jgi:hypothetical protein